MPRSYCHIKEYEQEIMELKSKGMALKEIGLKYIIVIARKDSKIKRLEMENKLMLDFLSLTEMK